MSKPTEKATPDDYRLLGLHPGAEPEEVKHAFRGLVKQWHPDRFQQRAALERHQAEERFKAISAAYRRIVAGWDREVGRRKPPRGERRETPTSRMRAAASSAARSSGAAVRERTEPHPPRTGPGALGTLRWPRLVLPRSLRAVPKTAWIALCVLLLIINLVPWERLSVPGAPTSATPARETPPRESRWPVPESGGEDPSGPRAPEALDPTASLSAEQIPPRPSPRVASPTSDRSVFSLGATPEEVLLVQGMPERTRGQTWIYGLSDVSFKDGVVARYNNFGGELKVQLTPGSKQPSPPPRWFTLGTSSDEVLWVQGTPTRVEGAKWYYGFAEVSFKNGRVDGFDNYFGTLKVRVLPSTGADDGTARSHFTVGSSMDDVLAAQGTPTSIRGNVWFYQFSNVVFRNGKVQSAADSGGVLRFVPPEESAHRR